MEDNFRFDEQKFIEERERYRSTAGWPTAHIETDSIGRETVNGQPIAHKRPFQESSVSKAAYLFDRKTIGLTDEEKIAIYNMVDAAVDAIFIRYKNVKSGKAATTRVRDVDHTHGNTMPATNDSIGTMPAKTATPNGVYIDAGIDYHTIHIPDRYGNMKKIKIDSSFFVIEDDE